MKLCIKSALLIALWILGVGNNELAAQDIIIKKDGTKIWTKIVEISDTKIKYYQYQDQGGLLFTMDRALIREIEFEGGMDYKEEAPGADPAYYVDDKRNNIKLNFIGFSTNTLSLTYERSISPSMAYEIDFKLFGLGINDDFDDDGGFGIGGAFKIKTGSIFKGDGYRPNHLLHGGYIRPRLGFGRREDTYWTSSSNRTFSQNYIHYGFDFGKQWIFSNIMSLDIFTGFHYYSDWQSGIDNTGIDRYFNDEIFDGDLFGSDNFLISFGIRVGGLFGKSKDAYQSTERSQRRSP